MTQRLKEVVEKNFSAGAFDRIKNWKRLVLEEDDLGFKPQSVGIGCEPLSLPNIQYRM